MIRVIRSGAKISYTQINRVKNIRYF
ncbi:Uncharacterized protein FWK35_00012649 [Aphis craccivora]|uniref:Uncharacterized protein n=1 Tax=Aphis craccivora TaxID=307492 RepID=A0A6G0ZJ81_APHCR|nr:Uncharacterized protein FWK35_00012649 [Aphis craccivora]